MSEQIEFKCPCCGKELEVYYEYPLSSSATYIPPIKKVKHKGEYIPPSDYCYTIGS